jgi:dihydrofolate reductase
MGKLIYLMNVSLDGYVETPDHSLDWATVDDEVHAWFNEWERASDASLYGRRLYEVMAAHWPTEEAKRGGTDVTREFARIWNAKPHLVFSRTLTEVDPSCELVEGPTDDVGAVLARIRDRFEGDLNVAGPTLASAFIERGLVDAYGLVVHPVILGGGTPFFPRRERPIGLRLVEERTFASGAKYLGYEAG